jgi:hypothetical protein
MKWLRVNEYGFDYRYLLSEPGETNRMIVAAVATASFNSAWPEGYGWEQWDPTQEVTVANVRRILPEVFRRMRVRARPGPADEVLCMDYVQGRRCKTRISLETRGEHRGVLKLDAGEYEATRGDVERLLMAAQALLVAARGRRGVRPL